MNGQLHAVVTIIEMLPSGHWNQQLIAISRLLAAVHQGPKSCIGPRPLASEDIVLLHLRCMRYPIWGLQEASAPKEPLYRCYSSDCFGIPRNDPVPDSPDILPRLVPVTVEVGKLQVIDLALHPAIADVGHELARGEELQSVNHRSTRVDPVSPTHGLPIQRCHIAGDLWLEHYWPTCSLRGLPELFRDEWHGVAIEAISTNLLDQGSQGFCIRDTLRSCAIVPGIVRHENSHSSVFHYFHHLGQSFQTTRHRPPIVILIPVVNPNVCVCRPEQKGIDTTIPLGQVIKELVHCEVVGNWIVEVAIIWMHLRLNV
mmetsp:Transcript_12185/g.27543  ORF Transcript_12185/g.27543 Transcript_12185/m.27543 type:complete len:314 (-) Transcript_12185:291-1232(-)